MPRYNLDSTDPERLTRLLDLALEPDEIPGEEVLEETQGIAGDDTTAPILIPDHQLIRRIGRGSYGEVWLARNIMGEFRAVKIVHRSEFRSDGPFERELAGIRKFEPISRTHESHLDLLHIGRREDVFYYVMELADDLATGSTIDPDHYEPKTLRSELKRSIKMSAEQCVHIGRVLAEALMELHQAGLVHRDIKPANIIFVRGRPKLADIGLVTDTDATATFVGTEGFVAPEGPGTPQADIYGLGKVLYELLTGEDRKRYPDWPHSAVVSEEEQELKAVIQRACESDRGKRYSDASALLEDLRLLERHESVRDRHRLERRVRVMRKVGVTAGLIALLTLGGFAYQRAQTREKERLVANAEAASRDSRQSLLQLAEDTAVRAMEDRRDTDALLWTARALDLAEPESTDEIRNLRRANWIYRNMPRVIHRFDLSHSPWLAEQLGDFLPRGARLAVPGTNSVRVLDLNKNRWVHELDTGENSLPLALHASNPNPELLS